MEFIFCILIVGIYVLNFLLSNHSKNKAKSHHRENLTAAQPSSNPRTFHTTDKPQPVRSKSPPDRFYEDVIPKYSYQVHPTPPPSSNNPIDTKAATTVKNQYTQPFDLDALYDNQVEILTYQYNAKQSTVVTVILAVNKTGKPFKVIPYISLLNAQSEARKVAELLGEIVDIYIDNSGEKEWVDKIYPSENAISQARNLRNNKKSRHEHF